MQPLGYYGLRLDAETEKAIDQLQLHELTNMLEAYSTYLNGVYYTENEEVSLITSTPLDDVEISLSDTIGLIRGLCDRIELKLMEAAK